MCAEARAHGLRTHLDGARLLNAVVASGVQAAEIGKEFDSVTLCLSKGLGCPLGALLATSAELAPKARRLKHMFGGAMRQAGVVAATGLYALDHHVERLAEDHANARKLAVGLAETGLPIDLAQVETNFVLLDAKPLGLTGEEVLGRLRGRGFSSPSPSERTCSAPSPTWTFPPRTSSARSRVPAELFPGSAAPR